MSNQEPSHEPMDERRLAELERRLDELEAQIQETRREAKAHGTLPHDHHEPTLANPKGD